MYLHVSEFLSIGRRQSGRKLKILRIDRSREFLSREFTIFFCDQKGIKHKLSTPYSSQQNGVTERKN